MTDLAFLKIRCAGGIAVALNCLLLSAGAAQPTAAIEANHTGKIVEVAVGGRSMTASVQAASAAV